MAYELKGTLVKLMDRQDFPSGFFKREFVVRTEEQYPQDVKFTLIKEKVEFLDSFQEGQGVQVSFDVKGREYNGNYYVDLQAWKLTAEGVGAAAPASMSSGATTAAPVALPEVPPMSSAGGADDDDLPF
jgi:single-strand DNA-binding protein